MKKVYLILLMVVAWIGGVTAQENTLIPPQQVIRELIQAAKANDLGNFSTRLDCGAVAMGPHGRSIEETVAFLRSIELDTVEILGTSTLSIPPPRRQQVMLRAPDYEIRFDLELRQSEIALGERAYSHRKLPIPPHYVVTEIHQHP